MKKITILLAAMLLSAGVFAADDDVVIRFSHVVKKNTPKDQVVETFKSLVEKYSNGKVRVENYPDSSLFNDRNEMSAISEGKVEMIAPSLSKTDQLYTDKEANPYLVFDIPFLFENPEQLKKLVNNPVLAEMSSTIEGKGVKLIGVWDNGLKQLSSNKAIDSASDLIGKKIRIQPSAINKAIIKSWGSSPRELSYAEVYNAMLYRTVDCAENPTSNFYGSRFFEVQKYLYTTHHSYLGYAWLVNSKFWDHLTPENKAAIQKAVTETNKLQSEIASLSNEYAIQDIKATGLTRVLEPSEAVMKVMRQSVKPAEDKLSPVQMNFYKKLKDSFK